MEVSHLNELSELEQSYWWHVAKQKLVTGLLKAYGPSTGQLVEGGIGAAGNLKHFQQLGYQVTGLDIMPESVEYAREAGLESVHQHDLCEPWPVKQDFADCVVLLDVVEHVPDPIRALQNAYECLKTGGFLFVTVPAYQWLFSQWDEHLGRYRRYTTELLKQHATKAGFETKKLTYWNSFTLPAAAAIRTWEKKGQQMQKAEFPRVSPLVNQSLLGCASMERMVIQNGGSIPCGLSVAGVFRK